MPRPSNSSRFYHPHEVWPNITRAIGHNSGIADGIKRASLDRSKNHECWCLVARMRGTTVYLIQFS
jgi:hypothetical protein